MNTLFAFGFGNPVETLIVLGVVILLLFARHLADFGRKLGGGGGGPKAA